MAIIGMDFGNNFAFTAYISGGDPDSHLGGTPIPLMPNTLSDGYPSVFFYSKDVAANCRARNITPPPWYGMDAVRTQARPAKNRLRNFKRHMNEAYTLDDLSGNYDELITGLIQYLMRQSNKVLQAETLSISNQLALAYPATFTAAQQQHLKNLAEKATLEDGTKIEVVGMIAEPAAAALDYLVEHGRVDQSTTVLVYDLGGGTFDLAVVTAYPQGYLTAAGDTRYFDVEDVGGLDDLGGTEFDNAMLKVLERKIDEAGVIPNRDALLRMAESAKRELSDQEYTECDISDMASGELVTLEIQRSEFEAEAAPLMQRTIDETRNFLNRYKGEKKPEMIVLTGGSSHMPMVQRELEKAFPQFAGKVQLFRPSRAISFGAARYSQNLDSVQTYAAHDIGIRFFHRGEDTLFVETYIPAHSALPFESEWLTSCTRNDGQTVSRFAVMEAKVPNPDPDHVERDYTNITTLEMAYDAPKKAGTPSESRLLMDASGLLRAEARDPSKPGKPPVHCELRIKTSNL